jgi:aminoglycoside phosphotransferase family enzyme/predicted kinase
VIDEATIRLLADPKCYPDAAESVTQYQTHLSLVCVVGDRAYKLKKSLQLPFVDFSTLVKRQRACEEELRLNARLCPDMYLGVVPLFAKSGGVSFCDESGGGEIIDWAVLMRRLPAERMMDVLLAHDAVTSGDLERIAEVIVGFHREVALGGRCEDALRAADRLHDFALANFDETAAHCDSVFDPELHRQLRTRTARDFKQQLPLLRRRATDGRVVDGHGDLHARNICLCEPMAIYDCLEFSRNLRVGDVAVENAFLLMDLRYRGHAELGTAYLDRYLRVSGDDEQRALVPMLLRYRAMVRAKVAAIASREPEIDAADREGFLSSARRHLNLVAASAIEQDRPWLICACGLPATGKSYLFDALERASGWPCFTSDLIRKELAGIAPNQQAAQTCYTREANSRTYAEVLRRAATALQDGPVLVDANFASAKLREHATQCARNAGAQIAFVWFRADDRQVELRMTQRAEDADQVSDADLSVYRKLQATFQPPSEDEVGKLIAAPTAGNRDQRVAMILRPMI